MNISSFVTFKLRNTVVSEDPPETTQKNLGKVSKALYCELLFPILIGKL